MVCLELQWLTINTNTPQLLEFCCLGMSWELNNNNDNDDDDDEVNTSKAVIPA